MGRTLQSLTLSLLLLSLILSFVLPTTVARPLNRSPTVSEKESFHDGMSLGTMKNSGDPSSGTGHKYSLVPSLRTLKDSGPSPGEGHGNSNGGHS